MANSNFIVQNGITVGPLTIDASTGGISTTGTISAGGFTGISSNQIFQSSSNVTVSGSYVNVSVGGSNVASFSSAGLNVLGTTTTVNTEVVTQTEIIQGNIVAAATTATADINTGALVVKGGVGIAGNVTLGGTIVPSANLSSNLGDSTHWFNTFYGVSTQAKYADLAENYQADKQYNPGTVVMFGGAAEVTIASADTTAVAGVVSTNPAHLMNGALTGGNVVPLALTGRVPCMVIGPIKKGDLMVSAGFGYAKASAAPQIGQVIGKALEDYPLAAKGIIEVVVGRL